MTWLFPFLAGKATTDEELEEMLESGNAAVFTAGVSMCVGISANLQTFPHHVDSDVAVVRKQSCRFIKTC